MGISVEWSARLPPLEGGGGVSYIIFYYLKKEPIIKWGPRQQPTLPIGRADAGSGLKIFGRTKDYEAQDDDKRNFSSR